MNDIVDALRGAWLEAQLAAPPQLQRALNRAKELARLIIAPGLPARCMQGENAAGPLTVTYIGLDYAESFLKGALFSASPQVTPTRRIPFWRLARECAAAPTDLVMVEGAATLLRRLPRARALLLPQYVHHILAVQDGWEAVKKRFHNSTRFELRLVRKYAYQYRLSHDPQEFEHFYHTMYLPTMQIRHQEQASPMTYREAQQYFRRGVLFFVTREGQDVCGSLCYPQQGIVQALIMGVPQGDEALLKEGVVGALYALRIEWAAASGYRAVNFLGSDPAMKAGLFQFKRKWGGAICQPERLYRQIWIGVQRETPAVAHFLRETPFVVQEPDGRLCGQVVVDDPAALTAEQIEDLRKHYATPGLADLRLVPLHAFFSAQAPDKAPGDGDDTRFIAQ